MSSDDIIHIFNISLSIDNSNIIFASISDNGICGVFHVALVAAFYMENIWAGMEYHTVKRITKNYMEYDVRTVKDLFPAKFCK